MVKEVINKNIQSFYGKKIKVPFFVPFIDKSDIKFVKNVLDSSILTNGPKLLEFEDNFRKFTKSKYALGVSNATSALQLSLKALGIKPNDEVIVPDLTFPATANAVLALGAKPVISDVELDTMNISIKSIKKNISKKTKAIIPVHFAGKSCNMDEIIKISNNHSLKIVEDCAHGIGTYYKNKHVGNFGETGCFSFYPTKNITTIEGGMIITNNSKIRDYLISSRNHGINKSLKKRYTVGRPWDYNIHELGYNYRLDELRSCLGISQLKKLELLNCKRKNAFKYYNQGLDEISDLTVPNIDDIDNHSCHLYIIRIKKNKNKNRDKLFKFLSKKGIITSVHYKPLHHFTIFKKNAVFRDSLVNSSKIYDEILSLPLFPSISKLQQNIVIKSIEEFFKQS